MTWLPQNVLPTASEQLKYLLETVPAGHFKTFPIGELPGNLGIPEGLFEKYVSVTVAVSDGEIHGVGWAGIVGNRLDKDPKTSALLFDCDPLMIGYGISTLTPSATGFLYQHCSYPSRTVPVSQVLPTSTAKDTVESLRKMVTPEDGLLKDNPTLSDAFQKGLTKSHDKFGKPVISTDAEVIAPAADSAPSPE